MVNTHGTAGRLRDEAFIAIPAIACHIPEPLLGRRGD